MSIIEQWKLRAAFARRLSTMYGHEVPAYNTLVQVAEDVNRDVVNRDGDQAQRLGSIGRITAERHGAIRVGTPTELAQVARIFGALGMRPVGFYDLREAAKSAVPVISTAFRPVDADELARNPFRVFTSMLTPADPRFFSPDLRARLESFLAGRELFGPELLTLADRAEQDQGLPEADAARFLELAVQAFELSPEPVDRAWYAELEAVSAVAADIGGVRSTHINHLTPRVLDIDDLYRRMTDRGIEMIDTIQGPPAGAAPDVLLRQTSFRALAEPRAMREPDGKINTGALRVRFGEVEARGVALTPKGRSRYDLLLTEIDQRLTDSPGRSRADVAVEVWEQGLPHTEAGLREQDLAYFTYTATPAHPGTTPPESLTDLVEQGWVTATPIVYEDFLPRSAAGIFQSNLSGEGSRDTGATGVDYDQDWLAGAINRDIHNPFHLYEREQAVSIEAVAANLNLTTLKDIP